MIGKKAARGGDTPSREERSRRKSGGYKEDHVTSSKQVPVGTE